MSYEANAWSQFQVAFSDLRRLPTQELTMLGKFPLTVGAWIILFSEVSAGDAETIGIYASKEDASNNDTTSWALLNSSAIVDTVDDFTVCVRFRVRMFPNLPAFFAFGGPGEEMDSDNKSLRFYLGYSSNMNGPSRSGFHIKFLNSTETLWAPMMDPDKSQEREIFLPNQWSHLCLSFSSDTRMIRYVLVRKIGMTRRVRPSYHGQIYSNRMEPSWREKLCHRNSKMLHWLQISSPNSGYRLKRDSCSAT